MQLPPAEDDDSSPDLGCQALRELVRLRRLLTSLESELVRTARLEGESWTTIAEALGLTRQGARQRHLAVDPLPPRRRQRVSGLDAYLARLRADRETMSG